MKGHRSFVDGRRKWSDVGGYMAELRKKGSLATISRGIQRKS